MVKRGIWKLRRQYLLSPLQSRRYGSCGRHGFLSCGDVDNFSCHSFANGRAVSDTNSADGQVVSDSCGRRTYGVPDVSLYGSSSVYGTEGYKKVSFVFMTTVICLAALKYLQLFIEGFWNRLYSLYFSDSS